LGLQHSIHGEVDFVSQLEARESAVALEFELGNQPVQGNWPCQSVASLPCHDSFQVGEVPQRPPRSVHFAEEVQILFGPDTTLKMLELQSHHDALHSWRGKPWGKFIRPWVWARDAYEKIHSLSTLVWRCQEPQSEVAVLIRQNPQPLHKQNRLTDAWHSPLPPEIPGGGDQQEEDPDVIPDPTLAPDFVHDVFELADAHRAFTNLDSDGAMRIRSWYVHHVDLRSNLHPRFLEFDEDWRHWERDLMGAWRDMIQPNQEVRIHVVKPDPYRGYLAREVHADIIVSQGTWTHRMPALITVHRNLRTTPPTSFALASSLARQVGGVAIASAADVLHSCNHPDITCTFTHSWATIPFTLAPIFEVHAGDSLTILIVNARPEPCRAAAAGSSGEGQWLLAPAAAPPHRPEPAEDCPDAHERELSDPSGGAGGGDDDDDMSSLHSGDLSMLVYRLAAPDVHCFVQGSSYMSILSGIIRASGMPRREARCFHYLAVTPVGVHAASEEAVILQAVQDVPFGSDDRLILVDVEIHFHPLPSGLLVPTATSRRVVRIHPQIHREQLLLLAGLYEYCQLEADTCVVYENHVPWLAQDTRVHDMEHGKYIRIIVPPPQDPALDTEVAIGIARDLMDEDHIRPPGCRRALAFFQQQATMSSRPEPLQLKTDPHHDTLPIGTVDDRGDRPRAQRHFSRDRTRLAHEQRQLLRAALRHGDLIECEEEGPVIYLTTWYLRPESHVVCYEGRSVRLTADEEFWTDDIVASWADHVAPEEPLTLRVVQPVPPCSVFECVQAHVILDQGLHPPLVPIVVSIHDQGLDSRRWQHRAYLTEPLQHQLSILRLVELQARCVQMRCSVSLRGFPIGIVDFEPLEPAVNIEVRLVFSTIPNWLQPADAEGDTFDLMQRTQPSSSTNMFRFNPNAIEFIPQEQQILRQQPEFVQDLHALWDEVACAWEDEARAGRVLSWFVDQARGPQVCNEPRPVVLYDDPTRWQTEIRSVWADHVNVNAPLEFHIVTPQPPQMEPNIIAHIILIQSPAAMMATPLVTIFDQRHRRHRLTRMAVTVHEHIEAQHIVAACGYSPWGNVPLTPFLCQVWHGTEPLLPGRRHPGRDADGFSLYITPVRAGAAGVQMLQTHLTMKKRVEEERQTTDVVAHAQWPSQPQHINFHMVLHAFDWFDSHLFLPQFDLPTIVPPHVSTYWTHQWWDQQAAGTQLRVYFDGSYIQHPDEGSAKAGTAIAAFLLTAEGWVFAGALSSALPRHESSYLAELVGGIVAHKFVYDLLKIHRAAVGSCPEVTLCYEALTIGHQAAGDWSCVSHPVLGLCLRSIVLLIENCFHIQLHYQHVRGHTGEPGNELVDCLANEARAHGGLTPFDDWIDTITTRECTNRMSWAWILFAEEFSTKWKDGCLYLPGPTSQPEAAIMPVCQSPANEAGHEVATLHLRISSCNVLTLKGTKETATSMAGLARQKAILRQLDEEKITIFALQETRLRRLHQVSDDDFFLLKAAADASGQGGIMVGVSRTRPYAMVRQTSSDKRSPAFFREDHLKVVAFDPRFLIIRIATPYLRCLVVAAHAPHSGQDLQTIGCWWDQLHEAVPTSLRQWPVILLADANAVVGMNTSQHIGDYQATKEDVKAEPFEGYVSKNGLWLPATFESCQCGEGATWTHSTGNTKRIDYVGVPLHWNYSSCMAWVSEIVDPTMLRADHAAVCVEARFELARPVSGFTADRHAAQRIHVEPAQLNWQGLEVPATCSFELDIHSHYQQLQDALIDHLKPQQVENQRKPLKTTISESTWTLVREKRQWRSTLADHARVQKKTILKMYFGRWKHRNHDDHAGFHELLGQQDRLIAHAWLQFRQYGRLVTQALRHDDKTFFANLLQDGAEFLEPKDVKKLWAVIRRSLPKFRNRRVGYSPYKLAHLEEQSARHFEQLEIGIPASAAGLVAKCVQDQARAAHQDLPACVSIESLPTLPEVEDALRATCADRATGFDAVPSGVYHRHAAFLGRYFYQVVLKMFVWGTEPVQGKGGFLKMIPKKLGAVEAKHFRGILLLPTLAKRVHAIARARLMRQASAQRDPAQLGGFAGQQVSFGSQSLRALTNVFTAKSMSSAILYVDLATAFHHLVRQLVTGIGSPADWDVVLMSLASAKSPAAAKEVGDQLIGVMDKLHIDPVLMRLLRDIHESTWYSLSGCDLVHTFRGTRPGSPLADAIFHLLMAEVATDLRVWISQHPELATVFQQLGVDPIFVIWSDDFAIPVASPSALTLIDLVAELTQKVHELFTARGFTINFDKGKTSAVLTFVGPHAPEMRKLHLLGDQKGMQIVLADGQTAWLHFMVTYKHLGTLFASSHSFEPELRQRIGTAQAAFQTVFRAVLGNRHYPLTLRLRFFQSLVCSKLFFGIGAWATPTLQQMDKLRKVYHTMLRKIYKHSDEEHLSNAQLLHATQALDVRVRLAIDRLSYAQRLFQVGPEFLQQLVHLEFQHCKDSSWLTGLYADLSWLRQTLPNDLPFDDREDLTQLIDYWQAGPQQWKRSLRKAVRRHRLQEEIMLDAKCFHRCIFNGLKAGGASFIPDFNGLFAAERHELHVCECGRAFTSSQGLALHKRKSHGLHAQEHEFVTGATCPACLRYFWTSNRLALHLAYMPRGGGVNECFNALTKAQFVGGFQSQTLPSTHAHAVRLDALQAEGPPMPMDDARLQMLAAVEAEIAELEELMQCFERPEGHLEAGLHLGDVLTAYTKNWIRQKQLHGEVVTMDLADGWIQLLDVHGQDFDEWAAFVFQQWGEHILPDISAGLLDGEIEYLLDEQFADTAELFPRTERLRRLARARVRHDQLSAELQQPDRPHRPIRLGTANGRERVTTRQRVPSAFHEQVQWHDALRTMRWDSMPSCRTIPTISSLDAANDKPCLLVVHLFSGRRREGDLHWQLQELAEGLKVNFVVLSMDTAVSPWYGDLWHSSTAWRQLEQCYVHGLVALTMVGSPCETYSEARFTPPPPGEAAKWPRPLRSMDWFYGLPDLTNRELKQVHTGTNFWLQGLRALGCHVTHGGLFLSEHPGMPKDPERPTTWRAPLTELFRQHPDIHLSHIGQWQWGAEAVKPTGLLAHRLPRLLQSLYACSLPDAVRPTTAAIGKAADGEFRTSRLKEYPTALSRAIAVAFCDQLRSEISAGRLAEVKPWRSIPNGPALRDWIQATATASAQIRQNATALPDYQPR